MTAPKLDPDSRFVALETRIGGIEDSLKQLILDFRNRGHIPWGVMITAAGAFAAGLLWVVTTQTGPLAKDQERTVKLLEQTVSRQDLLAEKVREVFVPRADLNDKFAAVDERTKLIGEKREAWQAFAAERMDSNTKAIASINDRIVPRGEHDQHWAAIDQRFVADRDAWLRQGEDKQRQINELRERFNELYSAKDVIRDDHDAIRRLEIELSRGPAGK